MVAKVSPLAGKTIEPSMLVNVPQLVTVSGKSPTPKGVAGGGGLGRVGMEQRLTKTLLRGKFFGLFPQSFKNAPQKKQPNGAQSHPKHTPTEKTPQRGGPVVGW